MDSFHVEVSELVCASERRLESGKDDDELTVVTYAFRYGCSSIQIQISWQPLGVRLRRFRDKKPG